MLKWLTTTSSGKQFTSCQVISSLYMDELAEVFLIEGDALRWCNLVWIVHFQDLFEVANFNLHIQLGPLRLDEGVTIYWFLFDMHPYKQHQIISLSLFRMIFKSM